MGGRATRRAIARLLISVLLVGTACTRPKPKEAVPQAEKVVPTMQPTPGQTVVSVRETLAPTLTPASEVPVVPLPTTARTPTAAPILLPAATPTPTSEGAPVPTETPTTHVVQRGETLFSIGQQYGIPWQDIARASGITSPYRIVVGQKLTIPRGGAPVVPIGGRVHIVQRGENLFRIGLKYGVPWQDIAQANGIVNPNRLVAGQKLVIP